jgi:hypothetical protein
MHVITYSLNFAPPHFTARGIPKNTPHSTMEGHTAYIYMLSAYLFRMELLSFSLYTKHTLLHGLIFFCRVWKSLGGCSSNGQTSLPACTLARRECTNQLTHQVLSEGQLPVSVCCRGGMICQVI